MLPNYLLEASGTAIDKRTGEVVELISKTEYRLETAEKLYLELKKKTINLVRRFTREQLVKLYNEADEVSEVSENTGETPCLILSQPDLNAANADSVKNVRQDETRLQVNETNNVRQEPGLYINETRYDNLRQASEILSISKDTISRRIKSDDFPTYYKIE